MENSSELNMVVDFANFLKENGDNIFEKNSKLCLKFEQITVLQSFLQHYSSFSPSAQQSYDVNLPKNKDFLALYKSNRLQLIQDFLFKVTHLKITADSEKFNCSKFLKLNIFGSVTYLEIKNIPMSNICDLQNLRNQLESMQINKSASKLQEILQLCGADQSLPFLWSKLQSLNLSFNNLKCLDNSLRLATSIEALDLSHNCINDCGENLHYLIKLKRLNLSFNNLEVVPSFCQPGNASPIEYLDLSYNSIEVISKESISQLFFVKYLNLNYNMIHKLEVIHNLRGLQSVADIKIERNPISLNPLFDLLITEIVSKIKNNKHRPNKFRAHLEIDDEVDHLVATQADRISNGNALRPELPTRKDNFLKINRKASKLRPTNVIILQENDLDDEDLVTKNDDFEHTPSSFKSSADYKKLQKEIESMKRMRQNYGIDWLLSTPKLNTNLLNVKELGKNENIDIVNPESDSNNRATIGSDKESELYTPIESYVIYRSLENDDTNDLENLIHKELSIVSMSDRCLLEKDETNTALLFVDEFSNMEDIQLTRLDSDKEKQVRIKFKGSCARKYSFENVQEFESFVECIKNILFNHINMKECEFCFCSWCYEFCKKSKFKMEPSHGESEELEEILSQKLTLPSKNNHGLTCTKCNKYLLHESQIQSENYKNKAPSYTSNGNDMENQENNSETKIQPSPKDSEKFNVLGNNFWSSSTKENASVESPSESIIDEASEDNLDDNANLNADDNSNSISRTRLETVYAESKRFKNNLKLYLVMNFLDKAKEEEESLYCFFKIKFLISLGNVTTSTPQTDEASSIEDTLCILTNRSILVFKVVDMKEFELNNDYEKCLQNLFSIEISKIEVIEISLCQNYIIVESNVSDLYNTMTILKFATFDIYQTHVFLNSLLRVINDAKKATALKEIRKKNQSALGNLNDIVTNFSQTVSEQTLDHLYSLEEVRINEMSPAFKFKPCSYLLFVSNDDRMFIVEENLSFFSQNQANLNKSKQFSLVCTEKITDIVNMRLFKKSETKFEIIFVDEVNSSKQVTWSFSLNTKIFKAQLISKIKSIWESIFYVELPIESNND